MKLVETDSGLPRLAGSRSGGTSSPARRGESVPKTLAAPRSLKRRLLALRESVWAPVLAKGAALLAGMLVLAAIGASSLARGSGVPLPAASAPAPHVRLKMQASLAPAPGAPGFVELEAPSGDAGVEPPSPAPSGAVTPDGKVILNLADASDLRHLPGIGAKRAEAILALRAKLGGRFKRLAELLRVKGIGPKGLKKIEPHVVLDAPKPA
ncbi:MAG TPA: helix-hairpin-helix domain-containing protein [Polyangiaceae bacterium]|nr:helix-hairpin-helix domain-containing protein [Polyangiaceae bacterium]